MFRDNTDSVLISRQKGNNAIKLSVVGAGRARDAGIAPFSNVAGAARSYGVIVLLNLIAAAVCLG